MIAWLLRILRRIHLLVHRGAAERSMDAELRFHVECEIAERIARGVPPDAARRDALAAFGNVEAIKELGRDARGTRTVEDLVYDLRHAVRQVWRSPLFAASALLTIAVGVGAATAIYSLVYGILLRPLPYAEADRLVAVWERNVPRNRERNVVSRENLEIWREQAPTFDRIGGAIPTSATLEGDGDAERLAGADVTPGYLAALGVAPAIGRDFTDEEYRSGAAVILSNGLWKRRFAADPAVVGRALRLSGRSFLVTGITPEAFDPPRIGWLGQQELWFPLVDSPQTRSWGRSLIVIARLREHARLAEARAEVSGIAARRGLEDPVNAEWSVSVVPLREEIAGDLSTSLLALMAAVLLLLMMAIVNVTTLSLSMLGGRQQELAVRRAIGATDRRLFRQLWLQSAVMGLAGTIAGAGLSFPAVTLLVRLLPPDVPRATFVAVDGPVLLTAIAVSLVATTLSGAVVAARGCRLARLADLSLSSAGPRIAARTGGSALVVAEIALAVALSVVAVLMARTLTFLRDVDLGFEAAGVVAARIALPGAAYASAERQRLFFDHVVERVRLIPGVASAGLISARPLNGIGPATVARDASQAPRPGGADPVADVRYADAGFFSTFRVRLEAGELFDSGEAGRVTPRAVVSSALARELWPGRNPVGRRIAIEMYGGIEPIVAGVVSDIHLIDGRTSPRPTVYLPESRFPATVRDVVMRFAGEPDQAVAALRAAVRSMDAGVPVYLVTPMPQLIDMTLSTDRLTVWLLGSFAIVALLLATIGVFGVFASEVTRRRKEIGIRMALGSAERRILTLLLATGLRRAVPGLACGWIIAWILGSAMESLLFGVTATDPLSFAAAGTAAIALTMVATLLPVRHALRASPLRSLREE